MNRLGIFLLSYESDEVADYILQLLTDLSTNLNRLIIVTGRPLKPEQTNKLRAFSAEILAIRQINCSLAACQYILTSYLLPAELEQYDELILFDDTFFGPLYPFSLVFENMRDNQADFWGITCSQANSIVYLQSYFLVFRQPLIASKAFKEYWQQSFTTNKSEQYHEVQLSKYFSDHGFKYAVYSDVGSIDQSSAHSVNHQAFNLLMLLRDCNLPVLSTDIFKLKKSELLLYNRADEIPKALNYIRSHYSYDLNLIYKYLLAKFNILDIKTCLNLNYILPCRSSLCLKPNSNSKVAVIAHLFFPDQFTRSLTYLKNADGLADIYITTDSQDKQKLLAEMLLENGIKAEIIVLEQRGRDIAALLVGSRHVVLQYEYVCFIHDKKSSHMQPFTVGMAFNDLLWGNMLKSNLYIKNVISLLDNSQELGVLVPPPPYHGGYGGGCPTSEYWCGTYYILKNLAKKFNIRAPISFDKNPIAFGTALWFKVDALKPLFEHNWQYTDFPAEPLPDPSINHALERIFPYIAQDRAYLTGIIMTDEEASTEIENLLSILNSTINTNVITRLLYKRKKYRRLTMLALFIVILQAACLIALNFK